MSSESQPRSLIVVLILLISLYLMSVSIIEKVLILQLNSFTAIEAKADESIPPLKQKAIGTSDLILKRIVSINNFFTFSIVSFKDNLLFIFILGLQYFFILSLKSLLQYKFLIP